MLRICFTVSGVLQHKHAQRELRDVPQKSKVQTVESQQTEWDCFLKGNKQLLSLPLPLPLSACGQGSVSGTA